MKLGTAMINIDAIARQFYRSKTHPDTPVGVGYAPDEWQGLSSHLIACGVSKKDMLDSGLVVLRGRQYYDRYRGIWLNLAIEGQIEPLKPDPGTA